MGPQLGGQNLESEGIIGKDSSANDVGLKRAMWCHVSNFRLAFLSLGDFHARMHFARSTIPKEKWGLVVVQF